MNCAPEGSDFFLGIRSILWPLEQTVHCSSGCYTICESLAEITDNVGLKISGYLKLTCFVHLEARGCGCEEGNRVWCS